MPYLATVLLLVGLSALAPSAWCASARAQSATPTSSTSQPDPSIEGHRAFEAGRYRDALDCFQRAYELTRAPLLLYNIGLTAERLRLDATTLRAFQLYLARYPDAPNRDEVEHRIHVLRPVVETQSAALASISPAVDAAAAPTSDSSPSANPYLRPSADVAPRSAHRVSVDFAETLLPSPYTTASGIDEPAANLLENPWFWIGSGVIAAAAVTTIIVVGSSSSHGGAASSGTALAKF